MNKFALNIFFCILLIVTGCECDDPDMRPTLPPGARIDTFRQADRSVIDVLWVIDNSPTMSDVQDNLAVNLISFFDFLDRGKVDYQIGVTTTDVRRHGGKLIGSPKILKPETPDVLRAFRGNVHVGTDGSAKEEGLSAADLLFEHNPDFLREDSYVFIVWVSDQDDRSFGEISYYHRVFAQLQGIGNENRISFAAIVGPDDEIEPGSPFRGCVTDHGTAQAGYRYIELVERTGGVWSSICDESFASTLEDMGATAVGLERKFQLSVEPDLEQLWISIYYPCDIGVEDMGACEYLEDRCSFSNEANRELVCTPPEGGEDGWIYEAETRSIFFQGESVPGMRARIEVMYMPQRRPLER